MAKSILGLFVTLTFSISASATECDTEMAKFAISKSKQSQICGFYSDAIFGTFKGCVFSTVRKFQKGASDSDIYKIPEQNIQGILDLCAGFEVNGQTTKTGSKKTTTVE